MVSIKSFKGLLAGLIVAVGYSSFVIDIISIRKVAAGENGTYPPAVVAQLVASFLVAFFFLILLATGGRAKIFTASNVAVINALLAAFVLGSTVATTVLAGRSRYCGPSNAIRQDCSEVMKAAYGLGYALLGFQLIYAIFLPILVSGHGTWGSTLNNIPPKPKANADMEKAPTH